MLCFNLEDLILILLIKPFEETLCIVVVAILTLEYKGDFSLDSSEFD